jgi:uncharacterized protein involved in tolerance to divalent cations
LGQNGTHINLEPKESVVSGEISCVENNNNHDTAVESEEEESIDEDVEVKLMIRMENEATDEICQYVNEEGRYDNISDDKINYSQLLIS